jgi:hypothetical protein
VSRRQKSVQTPGHKSSRQQPGCRTGQVAALPGRPATPPQPECQAGPPPRLRAGADLTLALVLGSAVLGRAGAQDTLELPLTLPAPETVSEAPGPAVVQELTLDGPQNAVATVVAQKLPAGVGYQPGSATLEGQPLPDPRVGADGTLYFEMPGPPAGLLHFLLDGLTPEMTLPPAGLRVRYPGGLSEVLQGELNEQDLAAAHLMNAAVPERGGVIRSPQDGLQLRSRRTVNVTVDVPPDPAGGEPVTSGVLSVNGTPVPDSRVGTRTLYSDGKVRLLYIAVPLEIGDNLLSALGDTVHVVSAGPAARLKVTPHGEQLADGSTPLVYDLDVRDALGHPADLPSVSLSVAGSEPLDPDADPNQSGQQVRIVDGRAKVQLRPLSLPGSVTLTFDVNGQKQVQSFRVGGDRKTLSIAHGGAQLSGGELSVQGEVSVETPVMDGKLYVVANTVGINQAPLPYSRHPAYGDASVQSQPLKAIGKVAARLELPSLHAEYGQDAAVDPVFGVHTGADGLNAETRGDTRFAASVTPLPSDQVTVTRTPDGTRVLRLPGASVVGSETLLLVTSQGGVEVSRRALVRGSDYVLGQDGLIEFPAPLLPFDEAGNDLRLQATYRSGQPGGGSMGLTVGASVTRDFVLNVPAGAATPAAALPVATPEAGVSPVAVAPNSATPGTATSGTAASVMALPATSTASVSPLTFLNSVAPLHPIRGSVSAGGLFQKGVAAFGVHLQLKSEELGVDALLANAGGFYGSLSGSYKAGPLQTNLALRAESGDYQGPGAGAPGLSVNAAASYALTPRFGVKLSGSLGRSSSATLSSGAVSGSGELQTAVVAAGVTYQNAPFRAELLLRKNFVAGGGVGVQGLLGYARGGTELTLSHAQDFGAGMSLSTLSATTTLSPDLKLGATLSQDWRLGKLNAGVILTGARAGVNYVASYDLPNEGGSLGRGRLAATTSIPLAPGLSSDLSASVSTDAGLTGSLGATLKFQDPGTQASLGADASLSPQGSKFDVKAVASMSYGQGWSLSGDGLSEFGSAAAPGHRYGLGLAWRGETVSALGYLRYRSGSFGEDRLSAEVSAEERPDWRSEAARDPALIGPRLPVRQSLQLRQSVAVGVPLGGAKPTLLGLGSAAYWLTDNLSLGGHLGALYQPGSPLGTVLGVEASYLPLPGLSVTAGYNFRGVASNLGSVPTRQGVYLRLDLMADEVRP